jgi:hypothetical protein
MTDGATAEFVDSVRKFLEEQDIDSWCKECKDGHQAGPCISRSCVCPCDVSSPDVLTACRLLKSAAWCIEADSLTIEVLAKEENLQLIKLLQFKDRIRAAVKLLYPDDMTPNAKRVFDSIFEPANG